MFSLNNRRNRKRNENRNKITKKRKERATNQIIGKVYRQTDKLVLYNSIDVYVHTGVQLNIYTHILESYHQSGD